MRDGNAEIEEMTKNNTENAENKNKESGSRTKNRRQVREKNRNFNFSFKIANAIYQYKSLHTDGCFWWIRTSQ